MSGICGIYSPRAVQLADRQTLDSMLDAISHRGPVARRSLVLPDAGLALGHVFDAAFEADAANAAPRWHADDSYAATLDGAVVNRGSLPSDSSSSYSDPSAGALIESLRCDARGFPGQIEGPFALAVYGLRERTLWLARDALGTKPLYYARLASGALVFASELKGVLAHPSVPRSPGRDAVAAYLTFGYVPAPLAIVEGAHKVFPGECLSIDRDCRLSKRRFWQMPPAVPEARDPRELGPALRETVIRGVERFLDGCRHPGVYLSGGVDSTIVLCALRALGIPNCSTYSLGFQMRGGDSVLSEDLQWAAMAARVFDCQHHQIVIRNDHDPRPLLARTLKVFDEPMLTPNAYSKSLLAEAARSHGVSSCFSGSGSGYLFERASPRKLDKLRKIAGSNPTPGELLLTMKTKLFAFDEQRELLVEPIGHAHELCAEIIQGYAEDVQAEDLTDWLKNTSIRMQGAEKSLGVQDRTAALWGVEMRHPFKDLELVRLSATIPAPLKGSQKSEHVKMILKEAFKNDLPEGIFARKLFGYPSYYWPDGELDSLRANLLSTAAIERIGIFKPEAVQRIMAEDEVSTAKSRGKQTWGLLMMQAWYESYVNGVDDLFTTDASR
jgi:asparagine synthase (glutamine-hydrolysing)